MVLSKTNANAPTATVVSSNPQKEVSEFYGKNLSMNQQQITEMNAILDNTFNQYKLLKEEIHPRQTEIRNSARQKIRALLTPEQQVKFDELVAQRDAQREAAKQQKNK